MTRGNTRDYTALAACIPCVVKERQLSMKSQAARTKKVVSVAPGVALRGNSYYLRMKIKGKRYMVSTGIRSRAGQWGQKHERELRERALQLAMRLASEIQEYGHPVTTIANACQKNRAEQARNRRLGIDRNGRRLRRGGRS